MSTSNNTTSVLQRHPSASHRPTGGGEARKIDAVAVISLMALSGLVYLLGVSPMLERQALARAQQAELTAARQKSTESQKELALVQHQLVDAQLELKAIPLHLQPGTLLNQRLALMTELAAQKGAALDDLQPGKSAPGAQFDTMPVHLAGTGSFPVVAALLHRLHREFPDTAVNTFDISIPAQDAKGNATFSIDLLWFTESTRRSGKAADRPEEPAAAQGTKARRT